MTATVVTLYRTSRVVFVSGNIHGKPLELLVEFGLIYMYSITLLILYSPKPYC